MPFSEIYRRQVALLIRVIPAVSQEQCFAMKGGTAINLFIRDMPRLSVDIDLTYLPIQPRKESLAAIDAAMKRIATSIQSTLKGATIAESRTESAITKLLARLDGVQIKIEVTPVLRGCVFEAGLRTVTQTVEKNFGFAEMQLVSFADLYAGKIVAALDRQHPRDFFDIHYLLANEGIDDALRKAFIVYLLSHDRPMAEVLTARRKDISKEFERGFVGMTDEPIALDELLTAREALIAQIVGRMPAEHRQFLISFEKGTPDWGLLGVESAAKLPAIQWRQFNLDKLPNQKREALVANLEKVLAG